jgi:uncharacterized peroxidase-related enzyme
MTTPSAASADVIDAAVPLRAGEHLHELRRQRQKIVDATQGSHAEMFSPAVQGVSVVERLRVALHAARLSGAGTLVAHYRAMLEQEGASPEPAAADARVATLLAFTAKVIERPIDGDRQAVEGLGTAGFSPAAVVAVSQLIAFVSYQIRLVAGLQAMKAAGEDSSASAAPQQPASGVLAPGPIRGRGFTTEVLAWKPWVAPIQPADASEEQMAALEAMSPTAKDQPYFLLLAHQPSMLLQRSIAFNAIMFAPGGMPRAERELGATVESRLNGCVYCASVHAQRFEQLAKRNDVIAQLFEDPATAGTTGREKAIVRFSAVLGLSPDKLDASDVHDARKAGLTDVEILDLVHAVALFAWANRLMLNLGEPVHQDGTPAERGQL